MNSMVKNSILVLWLAIAISACSSVNERIVVPAELASEVSIPGVPEARFWGDEWPKYALGIFADLTEAELIQQYGGVLDKPHAYLAISGGSSKGAFGAGLFAGWTASDTRPEFTMVTGVSTGALTAPFAFLGPDYDEVLKQIYTTTSTKDIVNNKGFFAALRGDSLKDTSPLEALIVRYITIDVLNAIAEQHKRGRRLFVGTVNLDAGRSVIWNIGEIAVSDHARKLELVHDILRASAAIPVAFPPVAITVEKDGHKYDELHVDGGIGSQVFVYPAALGWETITEKLKVTGVPKVYVIRNSFLEPTYHDVQAKLLPIASRAIESLIRTQGIGDLYQIHALCLRDGNDFNLAFIPSDFAEKSNEEFDKAYMINLYERGYQMGKSGYEWAKAPPDYILD